MKSEDYAEMSQLHDHRLIRIEAKKKLLEELIKDLHDQYNALCDDYSEAWRSRQHYINKHNESKQSLTTPSDSLTLNA